MLARVRCAATVGIDAVVVDVEVDVGRGLPVFQIVGLPETAVRESRDRVRAALKNRGYGFPQGRITVNLSPADIRKEGTGFDLPIAVGILAASGLLPQDVVASYLVMGELSLDGRLNPVRGVLSAAVAMDPATISGILVPHANAAEAAAAGNIPTFGAASLSAAVDHLAGRHPLPVKVPPDFNRLREKQEGGDADLQDVAGQEHAKHALEVAASGGHNLLMTGPPGSGKTMLARRLSGILPPLTFPEAIQTSRIHSAAGLLDARTGLVTRRPFRAPHHTVSDAGLVGGGSYPRPGEVSLAHHGVLFLDEFPEFRRPLLDMLRQPLEDREITVSRAATTLTFPASIMLVAAMNPCACGYAGSPDHPCRCRPAAIDRYLGRISGPLLDRIDIQIEVPQVPYDAVRRAGEGECSAKVRERVMAARERQNRRFAGTGISCNAGMGAAEIRAHCRMDAASDAFLEQAVTGLGLSARGVSRILKIARTLADMAGLSVLTEDHIAEAIQYRRFRPDG